jgi:hypothetical protein
MYLFDQPVSLSQRLYRGLRFATKYYKLERGEIICDKAFVSTSSRSDFSRSFGKHSKEQYLFEITGHFSGKDVGKFGEAEVLFPPGCTFLVDRVEGNHVWMHEVQLPRSNELSEQVDLTVSNATPKVAQPFPREVMDCDPPPPTMETAILNNGASEGLQIETSKAHAIIGEREAPVERIDSGIAQGRQGATTIRASQRQSSRLSSCTDELGSIWVEGRRRSARNQQQIGSIFMKGLRRSARLL